MLGGSACVSHSEALWCEFLSLSLPSPLPACQLPVEKLVNGGDPERGPGLGVG